MCGTVHCSAIFERVLKAFTPRTQPFCVLAILRQLSEPDGSCGAWIVSGLPTTQPLLRPGEILTSAAVRRCRVPTKCRHFGATNDIERRCGPVVSDCFGVRR